jgi:lipid A oxidase
MRSLALSVLLLGAAPAAAEVELSFYGGWAGAPDGAVTLSGDATLPDAEGEAAAEAGAQAGLRATYWSESGFGVALDYSRFDRGEGAAVGDTAFGDLSTLTLNGMRRFEDALDGVTPYVGAGLGIAAADLEAGGTTAEASGPAVSWVAGASVPLGDNWSVFGEYEGTYADIKGETSGGGTLESDTVTNSVNLGVSFSF